MKTHVQYMEQRRFNHLDGLRAVSIVLVFTAHLDYQAFWGVFHGGAGVSIFFVISGFIITTLLLREWDRNGRVSLKGFYVRRIFRIYPLYFLTLGFYAVLILVLGFQSNRSGLFLEAFPFFVFGFPEIVQLWSGPGVPFSLAWSIGIEEKFYLVWPILGFVFLARSWRGKTIALSIGFVLFAAAGFTPLNKVIQPYSIIALGCILALMLHRKETYRWLAQLGRWPIVLAVMIFTLVAVLATDQILIGRPMYVPFGILVAIALAGIITTEATWPVSWLSSRTMVFLGGISYGFYLTHGFALNAVQAVLPEGTLWASLLSAVIAFPLAVLIAWVLNRVIEKPLIRVGHKLSALETRTPKASVR